MTPRKIILDVDTGTDDAIAIAVAALSTQLEILGITVVHGNQPLAYTVENTLRVVQFLKKDIPVYPGCPEPMVQYLLPGRVSNIRKQAVEQIIDGEHVSIHTKYLDLPPATITPQSRHACSFILDTLKASKEKITLVAVGPLTNIAMVLRMDPTVSSQIEEIVIMGGAVKHGNRSPVAEANFYDDPEAAQIVLTSGCKVRLCTLDATETVLCAQEDAARFRKCSYVGDFAGAVTEDFIRRCTLLDICNNGAVSIHDAVTVCAVIDPSIVEVMRHEACDVDFSGGWADGQLLVDKRLFAKPVHPVFVVYQVNRESCLRIMEQSFCNAQ